MKPPSLDWKELIADDEAGRFAAQASLIRQVHATKNAVHGKGRFLHRKTLVAAAGEWTVHDNLPPQALHGVFAFPGTRPALVRLSHGSFDVQANTKPDIRGFAVKIGGISGPGALGGTTDHQDFLFINHDTFASRTSNEFLEVSATAAAKGQLGLVWHLARRYGLSRALARVKALTATLGKPFPGYNAETFSTALPLAVGPYAAKVRLRPLAPVARTLDDDGEDWKDQLTRGPLAYEVALQFFTDEESTPIENPPVRWSEDVSPFVPVATLTVISLGAAVESLAFDPWSGLADHRPLGEVMRSRKGAYYESRKARGAL